MLARRTMARLLVVDDDSHLREVLRFALVRAGHEVVEAAHGLEALERVADAASPFDCVLLDILMPELDGLETCRRLRQSSEVPILFLSSRDEELDRILGLELGADDYITKPFSPREVVTRVKVVLRRVARATAARPEDAPRTLRAGTVALDLETHRCHVGETEVVLTVTEFELLRVLLGAPGRVFTRDDLLDRAFGADHHVADRTIDSHVRRLRAKFAPHGLEPVETVYGVGYRLREPR